VYASSLIEVARCYLGTAGGPVSPASLREVLEARLTDPRKPRGIRYRLSSLVSVLVAGVACGYSSIVAIAGAAAGWDQEVLAGHGTRRNPVTGVCEPPSASTLGRVPALLDADEVEAVFSQWLAGPALDPAVAARIAARAAAGGTSRARPDTMRAGSPDMPDQAGPILVT
jgi:DDE_Tnp_1-associated